MLVEDAQDVLISLVRQEGQEPRSLEPSVAWRAFRRFMCERVTGVEEDAMLYEYLTATFDGPRRFYLTFCRQFALDDEGEQVLVQLHCEFVYEPTEDLAALGKFNQWLPGEEDQPQLRVVLDIIENRPEWAVIAKHRPIESKIFQEQLC